MNDANSNIDWKIICANIFRREEAKSLYHLRHECRKGFGLQHCNDLQIMKDETDCVILISLWLLRVNSER